MPDSSVITDTNDELSGGGSFFALSFTGYFGKAFNQPKLSQLLDLHSQNYSTGISGSQLNPEPPSHRPNCFEGKPTLDCPAHKGEPV
jgi:hypothetical protein